MDATAPRPTALRASAALCRARGLDAVARLLDAVAAGTLYVVVEREFDEHESSMLTERGSGAPRAVFADRAAADADCARRCREAMRTRRLDHVLDDALTYHLRNAPEADDARAALDRRLRPLGIALDDWLRGHPPADLDDDTLDAARAVLAGDAWLADVRALAGTAYGEQVRAELTRMAPVGLHEVRELPAHAVSA